MEETVTISAALIPDAHAAVAKVNKRAAKLGLPPFTITVSEAYLGTYTPYPLGQIPLRRALVDVTIAGEQPKYGGWRLMARVSREGGAVILAEVPGETVPANQRERLGLCDHCGKSRKRTATFVVGHDDGSVKQVGRQCIADFLGSGSETASRITSYLSLVVDFALIGSWLPERPEEGGGWSGSGGRESAYGLTDYLTIAGKVINAHGWRPSGQGEHATRHIVRSYMRCDGYFPPPFYINLKSGMSRSEWEKICASKVDAEEIRSVIEWALNASGSTYMDNIAEVARAGFVTGKTMGLMASVIPAFRKQEAAKAAWLVRREEALKSSFVGTVGERLRDLTVVLTDHRMIDTSFGYSSLYKMVDEGGNLFAWFSSNGIDRAVGETITITGTVKAHKTFKDIQETMLTRCKVSA